MGVRKHIKTLKVLCWTWFFWGAMRSTKMLKVEGIRYNVERHEIHKGHCEL